MSDNQVAPLAVAYTANFSIDRKKQETLTEVDQRIISVSRPTLPPVRVANSTYASKYNRAVFLFNHVASSTRKKYMFGSFLYLVHNIPVIIFFCLSLIAIILSLWIKLLMIIPIVIGSIYLIISIFNFIIFIYNGDLLADPHLIKDSHFRKFGEGHELAAIEFEDEWVRIRGDQTIFDEALIPHLNTLNTLQQAHGQTSDTFDILFYSFQYVEKYVQFPKQIIWHGILALVTVAVGIVIPTLFHCAWSKQTDRDNQICYML